MMVLNAKGGGSFLVGDHGKAWIDDAADAAALGKVLPVVSVSKALLGRIADSIPGTNPKP